MARAQSRRPISFADPVEVREFAADLSEAWLECRELGHLWAPRTAHWSGEDGCYYRTLRCDRCETERDQTLSDRGAVLSNSYNYPDGYLLEGMGRIAGEGRDMLRLASVVRTTQPKAKKRNTNRRKAA